MYVLTVILYIRTTYYEYGTNSWLRTQKSAQLRSNSLSKIQKRHRGDGFDACLGIKNNKYCTKIILSGACSPKAERSQVSSNLLRKHNGVFESFQSVYDINTITQFQKMQDEYGEMNSDGESFTKKDFVLESSEILPEATLRYRTYGEPNRTRDNVIVVCHALTGNASLHNWWGELLGDSKAFDTSQYFVVCCNILGSCYGSTNPQSINPKTGIVYGKDFPDVSVQDTVKLQLHLLQEELSVSSVKSVIGGSFGGMQALEFAAQAGSTGSGFVCSDGKHACLNMTKTL